MGFTTGQVIAFIRNQITDAFNRQNTASRVRAVLEKFAVDYHNKESDVLPLAGVAGLDAALLLKANLFNGKVPLSELPPLGGEYWSVLAKTSANPQTIEQAIAAATNALINGAPGALDALNELAAALGNDPNFATTITNLLANKANLVGGKIVASELPPAPWILVGNPGNQNMSQGPADPTNLLGSTYGNILSIEVYGLVLGLGCNYNRFGARVYNVTMGDYCQYNYIGSNSGPLSIAGSLSYSEIGDNVTNCTFGLNIQNLTVGNSCQHLQVGANCRHVEIYNCVGTAAAPFVIPPNTVNAIFRNNAPVVASSSSGPIANDSVTEPMLAPAVRTKLNAVGTDTGFLQIRSVSGSRIAEIPVITPCTILAETYDMNVSGADYQLDKATRGPMANRVFGQANINLSQLNALLTALTAAEISAGVKIYCRSISAVPADLSLLILKFQYT